VHFFDEIGYEHPPFAHIPVSGAASNEQCMTREELEQNGKSCVLDLHGGDSCLKGWLWRMRGITVHNTILLPPGAAATLKSTASP
jgi:hypothetical protein